MKDLHSKIALMSAIGAAIYDADTTPAAIDLQDYNSAAIALSVGIGGITFSGTNKIEFVLTHSDDDSSYEAVADADVQGATVASGGIIKTLDEEHAAATVYRYGYIGGKRYLKLQADFSGTHGTETPLAAMVIAGSGYSNPQADQA